MKPLFAGLLVGLLFLAPAFAQTAGNTPNTAPEGTGNFVSGKPHAPPSDGQINEDYWKKFKKPEAPKSKQPDPSNGYETGGIVGPKIQIK